MRAAGGDRGRYCGYYFDFANWLSGAGSIVLSLVRVYVGVGGLWVLESLVEKAEMGEMPVDYLITLPMGVEDNIEAFD
ncbi:hypothetical protein ACPTIH_31100, partial [Pseudomonas aeruginosa]